MAAKHVIRVDDDVLEKIRDLAGPGETPNNVLRRVFGLPPSQERRSSFLRPYEEDDA